MAKAVPDAVLDAMFDRIIADAEFLHICSDEPANYAGVAAVSLADVALDTSDFTKANGDTSGRKLTIAQQTNIPIDNNGTATHVVLVGFAALLYVTTCTSQVLTAGGTVTTPAWDIEIADPT